MAKTAVLIYCCFLLQVLMFPKDNFVLVFATECLILLSIIIFHSLWYVWIVSPRKIICFSIFVEAQWNYRLPYLVTYCCEIFGTLLVIVLSVVKKKRCVLSCFCLNSYLPWHCYLKQFGDKSKNVLVLLLLFVAVSFGR